MSTKKEKKKTVVRTLEILKTQSYPKASPLLNFYFINIFPLFFVYIFFTFYLPT